MEQPLWIGTSWKMNKTLAQARDFARTLRASTLLDSDERLQGFVIPPFTALETVCRELVDTPVLVGAQNMHWADAGAFTGEVSPPMVADCGADIVELGHSERREYFNETDEAINRKVKAALAHGLRPLICIGETATEKALGAAEETVVRQAKIALSGVSPGELGRCLLAYEPVWAIGDGGSPATPEYAQWIHRCLRAALPRTADGQPVPVLYGGSVNEDNCTDLAALPEVSGLFIGRAAWDADGFLRIVSKVASTGLAS